MWRSGEGTAPYRRLMIPINPNLKHFAFAYVLTYDKRNTPPGIQLPMGYFYRAPLSNGSLAVLFKKLQLILRLLGLPRHGRLQSQMLVG